MSAANSAAKKRRAPGGGVEVPPLPQVNSSSTPNQPAGYTIQQIFSIIDKRLSNLEKSVTDIAESKDEEGADDEAKEEDPNKLQFTKEIMDDFNAKFEFFADELENLKNTVMTLQTYTLSVNKMLLESNGKFRNIPNIAINK